MRKEKNIDGFEPTYHIERYGAIHLITDAEGNEVGSLINGRCVEVSGDRTVCELPEDERVTITMSGDKDGDLALDDNALYESEDGDYATGTDLLNALREK